MNNEMNKIAFSLLTFFPVGIQTNSTASSLYSCGMLTVGNITLYTPAVQLTVAFACARSTCKFPTYPDFASSVEFVCDQVITSVSLVWNEWVYINTVRKVCCLCCFLENMKDLKRAFETHSKPALKLISDSPRKTFNWEESQPNGSNT